MAECLFEGLLIISYLLGLCCLGWFVRVDCYLVLAGCCWFRLFVLLILLIVLVYLFFICR